jgi:hypothetical protein
MSKDSWEKAHARYDQFEKQISALLQKERPADARDLLAYQTKKLVDYPNVASQYFPITVWLYRFDPQMQRALNVNINSFRFQRNLHQQQVHSAVSDMRKQDSGEALFEEISRIGKNMFILPYWKFGQTAYKNDNSFFGALGSNSTAQRLGKPDDKGHSDAAIQFTASMWGQAKFDPKTNLSTGTAGKSGPSTGADEVLFHEMVHGTRGMRRDFDKTKVNAEYGDKEEYIAIVVTNIYLAEKAKDKRHPRLRANHGGFDELPFPDAFIDNKQHINISPRKLIKELFNTQRAFFKDLARIPERKAWWNPARTVATELGIPVQNVP